MPFLAIVAAATALSATPEPQANRPGDPTRLSIQRGLDFLEKKGLNYVAEQKCAACHHVPMFFWSAHEARRSGFSPNPRVFSEVEGAALEPFLKNPKVQVNIKDGKPVYIEDKQNPSPEMVYLLASLGDELALPAEKIPGLERFLTILIESQGANGSWTLKNWKAPKHGPCYPGNDQGYTLWVLLALRTAERTSLPREMVAASRQRALDWLSKAAPTDSAQEQALLLVIYSYSGKTEEAAQLVKKLLSEQHPDGGWGYANKSQPSNAGATGMVVYALRVAGLAAEHQAIRQGRDFLVTKQDKDGRWSNGGGNATYFTTGWAVIGLARALPAEAK